MVNFVWFPLQVRPFSLFAKNATKVGIFQCRVTLNQRFKLIAVACKAKNMFIVEIHFWTDSKGRTCGIVARSACKGHKTRLAVKWSICTLVRLLMGEK